MSFNYINNYIKFGFDPYKFIQDGIDILMDNNIPLFRNEKNLTDFIQANTPKGRSKPYNWRGYNSSSSLSAVEQFNLDKLGSFIDQDLINEFDGVFSEIKAKLDLGGDSKPARIKFTEKPIGVFSFSQASIGLTRAVEFYCKKEKKVIDKKDVFTRKEQGKSIFYYLKDNEEFIVQKRQEGTTDILESCDDLECKFNIDSSMYLPYDEYGKIVNKCNGIRLKFTTTTKKIYALRDKKGGGIAPYVDLYIPVGANSSYDPEQMMIRAVPSIVLGRILERSGVRVRIFAVFSQSEIHSPKRTVNLIFKVKDFGETTDLNKLIVFSADPRFFRYHLFNASLGHNYSLLGDTRVNASSSGADYSNFASTIMPSIRNFVDYKIKIGEFPSQVVNKRLMLYGGLNSNSTDELSNQNVQDRIMLNFYRNMDYIQLNLSKTPKEVMQEIIKRMKLKNNSDFQIKTYLQEVITDVFSTTSEIQTKTPEELKQELDSKKITDTEYKKQLHVQIQLDTQEYQDEIREERRNKLMLLNQLMP